MGLYRFVRQLGMRHDFLRYGILGVVLVFGTRLSAQSVLPIWISVSQTFTTGIVGLAANQNARLNVLNVSPVATPTDTTVRACAVELQFNDAQNKVLLQSTLPNVAPGTATSLVLKPAGATSTANPLLIRGVVTTNPPSPTASPIIVPTSACSLMMTLEIFDSTTGETKILTSDMRLVAGFGPLPHGGTTRLVPN
jgi:hypothetical protein